jgi:hypothetical protein
VTEAALKTKIVKWLQSQNVVAWRNPSGPFSESGLPDIFAVLPGGRLVAIEAKQPGRYSRPIVGCTEAQKKWLHTLGSHGAITMCVDSLETVKLLIYRELELQRIGAPT